MIQHQQKSDLIHKNGKITTLFLVEGSFSHVSPVNVKCVSPVILDIVEFSPVFQAELGFKVQSFQVVLRHWDMCLVLQYWQRLHGCLCCGKWLLQLKETF